MTIEAAVSIAAAALVVAVVALLLAVWLVLRTRRLARLAAFQPNLPDDLRAMLEREIGRLDDLVRQVEDARDRLPTVERQAMAAVQHVGIVRFNPFEDTGGQQSFVLAMLDASGTGFVVSSLHSRQATRLYLKQLTNGRSEAQLSEEETEALRQAGVPSTPK